MSDSMSAYYDDLNDYYILSKLLDVNLGEFTYDKLDILKKDQRVIYSDYMYKLK